MIDQWVEDFDIGSAPIENHNYSRIVVRVKTVYWQDKRGIHQKKSVTFLRKLCTGFNGLKEDADCAGAEGAFLSMINLDQCKDGVYQAVINSTSLDWESGLIDEWDWKLIPYKTSEQREEPTNA